jgi:hypothetical protein
MEYLNTATFKPIQYQSIPLPCQPTTEPYQFVKRQAIFSTEKPLQKQSKTKTPKSRCIAQWHAKRRKHYINKINKKQFAQTLCCTFKYCEDNYGFYADTSPSKQQNFTKVIQTLQQQKKTKAHQSNLPQSL